MPIYEYRCEACQSVFEVIQRFSDAPLEACEKCGSENPEKLVSSSAFHLKGSGWYATDYGDKTKGTPSKTASDGASKSESKPESKASSGDSE